MTIIPPPPQLSIYLFVKMVVFSTYHGMIRIQPFWHGRAYSLYKFPKLFDCWVMENGPPPKGEASFLEDYKMNWFQIYPALLFSLPLVFQTFSFPKKIPEQTGIYKTAFYILVLYTMNKVSYYRDYHIQFICRHSGFSMMEGGGSLHLKL